MYFAQYNNASPDWVGNHYGLDESQVHRGCEGLRVHSAFFEMRRWRDNNDASRQELLPYSDPSILTAEERARILARPPPAERQPSQVLYA